MQLCYNIMRKYKDFYSKPVLKKFDLPIYFIIIQNQIVVET